MRTVKILLPLTMIVSLLFIGCGKYDEGPAFSLKTKKARLSRTWKVDKYIDKTGTTATPTASDNFTVTFTKDGTVTYASGGFSYAGTWEFTSDKTGLVTSFTVFGVTDTETQTILRLTSKDLWLEDNDGDKVYYIAQ